MRVNAGNAVYATARWTVVALSLAACGPARPPAPSPAPGRVATIDARFAAARGDSVAVLALLAHLPKGGDLHSHLSGAIRAESYVRWAAADGLCYVSARASLTPPPCGDSSVSARALVTDPALANTAIDAWSTRGWRPGNGTGHDHFFATFGKFGPATRGRLGDMLAEATAHAAAQRVSYLELMVTLDEGIANRLARQIVWNGDLGAARRRLAQLGLRDSLRVVTARLDSAETRRRTLLHCDDVGAEPGCRVVVRYLYQVIRALPPAEVFAQVVTGFELAELDSRVVGLNLVAAEDGAVAMRDFPLHMRMIEYLHGNRPRMNVSLHAGELSDTLVGSAAPRSHIRESIRVAGARRIGHGVDLLRDPDPAGLLRLMASRGVLVEIGLTSNDVILGVRSDRHPLRAYLAAGVPVAFATDDEGVSRSSLTHEMLRAVQDQRTSYGELRTAVRNSIAYSFAEDSVKFRLQADLERALAEFEAAP